MFKEERNTSYPTSLFIDWPLKPHIQKHKIIFRNPVDNSNMYKLVEDVKCNKSITNHEKVDHTTF